MREELEFRAGLDGSAFKRGLTSIQADAKGFSARIASSWKSAFGAAAVVAGIREIGESMLSLRRQAEDLGVGTDFLQSVGQMAVKFGGTTEDANTALTKLTETIGQARTEGGAAAEKFARFGVTLYDANGAAKTTEEIFKELATAYRTSTDAATKAALAFEFFGRTGRNINNILGEGAEGIDAYTEAMRKLWLISSPENVNAIADAWGRTKVSVSSLASNIGGNLLRGLEFTAATLGAIAGGARGGAIFNAAAQSTGYMGGDSETARESVEAAEKQRREGAKLADIAEKIEKVRREGVAETDTERLANLKLELDMARELFKGEDDAVKKAEKRLKLEEAKLKVAEAEKKIEQDAGDLQMARMDRMGALLKDRKSAEETIADRTRFTLGELAGANIRGISDPTLRSDAAKAREVQSLMEKGERLRISGRAGSLQEAQAAFTKADEIRRGITSLKSEERFTSMDKNIAEVNTGIKEFNKLANETGFVVRPLMGK